MALKMQNNHDNDDEIDEFSLPTTSRNRKMLQNRFVFNLKVVYETY